MSHKRHARLTPRPVAKFQGVHFSALKKDRVQLTEQWAKLLAEGDAVAVLGNGDHLEIWPREVWERKIALAEFISRRDGDADLWYGVDA